MVYVAYGENELNIWWDARDDKKDDMYYKIIINDKNCVFTNNTYYDFKNLESGKRYEFQIQVVDEFDNIIGRIDKLSASTLATKKRINLTLAPYNAVGDGKTDNTLIIQKAIDENPVNTEIYLPLGVYVCGNVFFNGSCNLRLDAGATLISSNKDFRR